jgi:predicted nucleotidyltransferase
MTTGKIMANEVRVDPNELVFALSKTRYTSCDSIFFCGSASRGEQTAFSDVDIIVLFDRLSRARRETFRQGGWLVDAQIHDVETLNHLVVTDARLGSSIVAKMIVDGIVVPKMTTRSELIVQVASKLIAAGPPPQDFSGVRYMVANIITDLKQTQDRHEILALGVDLYKMLATFYFRSKQEWAVSKKMIPKVLKVLDPDMEQRLHKVFITLFADSDYAPVVQLAEDLLASVGGPIYENFQMNFPVAARLAIDRHAKAERVTKRYRGNLSDDM